MGLAKEHLVDALIAYWTEGPGAVSEESRRACREIAGLLARSLSGAELLAVQEAPQEHRREIEAQVATWLANADTKPASREVDCDPPSPRPEPASSLPVPAAAPVRSITVPEGIHIRQKNDGGINIGTVGTVHGGMNLSLPGRDRAERADPPPGQTEAQKVRVLFLGANPQDTMPLRLDEEVRAIDRALSTATLGNRFELMQKWAVRVGEIQEHMLRAKPHVLHFSGHGSRDRSIALQGDDGRSRPVAAERLARLLARFNQRLRCVVLNACYSQEHGDALVEYIDCVVGMSAAVPDPVAIRFAAAFYQAAASGCSVEDSFEHARSDIELGELGGEELPVLLARRCDPAEVFLVKDR
jgi:hypothetical protein